MKKIILLLCIFTLPSLAQMLSTDVSEITENMGNSFFIENKGQWPSEVRYLAKTGGMNIWITNSGAVYDYYRIKKNFTKADLQDMPEFERDKFKRENTHINGHVLRLEFLGTADQPVDSPSGRSDTYFNYYIGNDPAKWATEVSAYEEVVLQDVYEGIDIRYYYDEEGIRYDYQVDAGADITKIRFNLEGAELMSVNENGELVISTSLGEVLHGKLLAYQGAWYGAKPVEIGFTINERGTLGLDAAAYDKGRKLIIDPLLYATYLGGSDAEELVEILRRNGRMIVCGTTFSVNFPVSVGAYSTTKNEFDDFFITEFNAAGTGLKSSTYIGGSDADICSAAAKDGSGNIIVAGYSGSNDFPMRGSGYSSFRSGLYDCILLKYVPNTNSLIVSTYLGGGSFEYTRDISISSSDNIFVAGITSSSDFPINGGAIFSQPGGYDGFVAKFNNGLTSLLGSTYLGGTGTDFLQAIVLDDSDNPYVCGETESNDFPTTSGAFDRTYNGTLYTDIFITVLSNALASISFSTYLGGSQPETVSDMVLDASRNPIILGSSVSNDYPYTPDAYKTFNQNNDIVLTKMNPTLGSLLYSTYFGGSIWDESGYLAIDSEENIIFTGEIKSNDFPTTPGAFSRTNAGSDDLSITKLDITSNTLIYSTYYGGTDAEKISSIFLLNDSTIYCAGNTESDDLPMTPVTFQPNLNGTSRDGHIVKFELTEEGTLNLTSPAGGENWEVGTIQPITWESTKLDFVKLEYTDDGFNWYTIAAGTDASNGLYNWTIPNTPGTNCYVRISSVDFPHINDLSDSAPFTIFENALTVTSPNGGETYRAGAVEAITWNSTGIDNVKIEYSLDNGSSWTVIDPSVAGSLGSYDWTVPDVSSTEALIRLSDELDPSVVDQSAAVFTIGNPTATINFTAGWNVLSVPWTLDDPDASTVFPTKSSDVFAYSYGYYLIYNLQPDQGFWVKFPSSGSETVGGQGYSGNTVEVFTGWNIIGTPEYDAAVSNIIESTPGMVVSDYYEYNSGYSAVSTLVTGKGYWVKCSQPGTLTLPSGTPKVEPLLTPEEDWITVTVSDAAGNSQQLYIADASGNFELPPVPPNEIFDARFGDDRYISNTASANRLKFQSEHYPLTINVTGGNLKLTDGATGTVINRQLLDGESITITNKNISNLNISTVEIPTEYTLYQNYPNPFNPATTIKFGLPQAGKVEVIVYDQLGQIVETLINEELEAGYHELQWNAMQYSSGVYFYTINSGNFKSVKKMLLLK